VTVTVRPIRDEDQWPARRPALWPIPDLPQTPAETTLIAQSPDGEIQGGVELSHTEHEDHATAILRGFTHSAPADVTLHLLRVAENWAQSHRCLDWIGLLSDELDARWAARQATDPRAGGIDLFLGATRQQASPDGQSLTSLDYAAYPDMALTRMQRLLLEARRQWPIARAVLLHRIGRVPLGQSSVLIAVACPHRAEAFEACRWLIDTLKVDVPIWKQERWSDGRGAWVEPPPRP